MATFSLVTGAITLFVGLGLALLGRKIIKILVFVGGGIAGANIAYALLGSQAQSVRLLAALIGFLVLGFLSLAILKFIFAAMLGVAGYFIAAALGTGVVMGILVGIIIFVLGLFLFKYYVSIATAFGGGILVFAGLQAIEFPEAIAFVIALVVGIAGTYYQFKQIHE